MAEIRPSPRSLPKVGDNENPPDQTHARKYPLSTGFRNYHRSNRGSHALSTHTHHLDGDIFYLPRGDVRAEATCAPLGQKESLY